MRNNLFISFLVFLTIFFCTIFWDKIYLNFSNFTGAVGNITKINYSTDADTLRYVVFIISPLLVFFFSSLMLKKNQIINFSQLIYNEGQKNYQNNYIIYYLIVIFCIFLTLEFLSLNLPNGPIDTFHDGEILVPAQNYFLNKNFFLSSYTVHGASDIFYPVIVWKIFGIQSVGAARTFFIILIFILKLSCVFLSYQITKISSLTKENKIIFFIIFLVSIVSMSHYQAPINFSYFSYRDIFLILFLIFFIELFTTSKNKLLSTILISVIASIAFLFHFDIGVYLNVILVLYAIYLIITKKYYEILIILLSLLITWALIFLSMGFDELKAFIDNALTIIFSMDYLHGTMYPEPFFSIRDNPDGTRATRGLLLQISAGIFVIYNVIDKNSKFSNKEKIFFIFLFFLSFIMYKNALGRSDSYHIRMSNDLPILINIFFILNFLLHKIETHTSLNRFFLQKNYTLITCILFFLILVTKQFNFNFNNIKNTKKNYTNYVSLDDNFFLKEKVVNFVSFYKKISLNDHCVENFTYDQVLPYLLKKPTCTKYSSPWIASPLKEQNKYIEQLKSSDPTFIIYKSGKGHLDSIPMSERLYQVNKYILYKYEPFQVFDIYVIYKKKN